MACNSQQYQNDTVNTNQIEFHNHHCQIITILKYESYQQKVITDHHLRSRQVWRRKWDKLYYSKLDKTLKRKLVKDYKSRIQSLLMISTKWWTIPLRTRLISKWPRTILMSLRNCLVGKWPCKKLMEAVSLQWDLMRGKEIQKEWMMVWYQLHLLIWVVVGVILCRDLFIDDDTFKILIIFINNDLYFSFCFCILFFIGCIFYWMYF